jgi:hypothetical protein
MNREEGYGFVVAVHSPDNTEDPPTVDVSYDMDNTNFQISPFLY